MRFLNWPIQAYQWVPDAPSESPKPPRNPAQETTAATTEEAQSPYDLVLHTEARQVSHQTAEATTDHRFLNQVFPSARSSPVVVSLSPAAWQSGIRPGLTLVEARSIESESSPPTAASGRRSRSAKTVAANPVQFEPWVPDVARQALKDIAERLRQFAPVIAVDTVPVPDCLLLDVTGCGLLFGGEVPLAEQLLKTVKAARLEARVAISESVASAWAFTHPQGHAFFERPVSAHERRKVNPGDADWDLPLIIIPQGQAETWLANLPAVSGRLPLADIELLRQLGIVSLKQLLNLPQDDLPSRISEEGRLRLRQLRGLDDELLDALPEANPVQSVWVSEYGVRGKERVKLVLKVLVEDVVRQLNIRSVGAIKATCDLKTEADEVLTIVANVVRPVQTENELLEILHLKLETLRLRDTVMSAKMVLQTAPLPVRRQKDLFSTEQQIRPEEELTTLINRLSSRLSSDAVLTAEQTSSPVPEQSIQLNPIVSSDGNSPGRRSASIPERLVDPDSEPDAAEVAASIPIRLLAPPVAIAKADLNPVVNGFVWDGTKYQVQSAAGPERIQSRWWDENAVHRDYYRIVTSCGAILWIFRDLKTRKWYLHGVFD